MKRNKKRLIVMSVMAMIVITVIVMVVIHNIEAEKRAGEFAKYENWRSATIDKVADYCDIDLDKVNKIQLRIYDAEDKNIGYIVDGEKDVSVTYIVDDEDEIGKLIEKLRNIKVYGAWHKLKEDKTITSEWELKLYVEGMEYALSFIYGDIQDEENVEVLRINVTYTEFPECNNEFPDPDQYLWSDRCLIYNEELAKYLYDMYNRYIKNISTENILNIYDEGNTEKFFAYENSGGRMKDGYDMWGDEIYSLMYTFPIEDFNGYVLLEKQSAGIDNEEGKPTFYTDIIDVKIYNEAGESIDFLNTTRKVLEEFLR